MRKTKSGFTIVELLIVIVVIGILAAITIVAYNGIQNRARASAASSALNQAAKKIAIAQVDDSTIPTCASFYTLMTSKTDTPTNTSCSFDSGAVNYQYKQTPNSTTPTGYCITATNGTVSYTTTNTSSTPTVGACSGHGSGGSAAITNIVYNPLGSSTDNSEWGSRYGMTTSVITGASDGPSGISTYRRFTNGSSVTGGGRGVDHRGNMDLATPSTTSAWLTWPVTAGQTYVISSYMRSSVSNTAAQIQSRIHDGSGNWLASSQAAPTTNYSAGNWIRLTQTITPSTSGYLNASTRLNQSVTWPSGATIDITGLMITQGSTVYNYADPVTSTAWDWTGVANNSPSTGPPQ